MVKDALEAVGPLTFVALRFTLATAVLLPALIAYRKRLSLELLASGGLAGFCLFAGYALQTTGLEYTSASKAGFITGLSVVIVPLIGTCILRQPIERWTIIGVALAVVGLALLSLREDLSIQFGDLLVLGCALAFALHILVLGAFAPKHDILALTSVQVAVAAVLNILGALWLERPSGQGALAVWPAALFTGLL